MSCRRTHLPPLPRGWPTSVKSAVLHVISLAQYSLAQTRGWAADSWNARVGLKARLDRANQEIALLREEMRIKDARMKHLPPHQRPLSQERMCERRAKMPAPGRLKKLAPEVSVDYNPP